MAHGNELELAAELMQLRTKHRMLLAELADNAEQMRFVQARIAIAGRLSTAEQRQRWKSRGIDALPLAGLDALRTVNTVSDALSVLYLFCPTRVVDWLQHQATCETKSLISEFGPKFTDDPHSPHALSLFTSPANFVHAPDTLSSTFGAPFETRLFRFFFFLFEN